MRRLTRWEYNNTVRDVLGDTTEPASNFTPEARQFGFDNNADSATYHALIIEDYERASREIAARAIVDMDRLLNCNIATVGQDPCVDSFVPAIGLRLFRRPLTADERDRYLEFYADNKAKYDFSDGVRLLLSAMLQSPHFLYRIELGVSHPAAPNAVRLTAYETATRLSYLLWGTAPTPELLAAAEHGELETSAQVRAHAERMLDEDRGTRAVKNFYAQWGSLYELDNLQKEDEAFTETIAALMKQEAEAYVEYVFRDGDGTMSALLTDSTTFLNADLAEYYGISGVTGDDFTKVELDPTRASGMMTQGATMARLAHPELRSHVNRGLFVLEKLPCAPPPPPPDNVDTTLPPFDPEATSREQLEQKTSPANCKACHQLMNPVGFAFGHYDELGRWKADEHGLEVDTTAVIDGTDVQGDYAGQQDMLAAIAQSPQMHACLTIDWFRYAFGRDATHDDKCTVKPALDRFMKTGGNIRELLLALTESPAFLYRTRLDIEGGGS